MNIIHIGFPKTATTFLQWEVFPHLKGIHYVDYRTCEKVFPYLIYLDDLDYDHAEAHRKLEPLIRERKNILSFESLAGAPFIYKGLGRSRIPERLKQLGFERVIITVRDQVAMMDSLYRQYVLQGGVMRFKDFMNRDGKWNLYVRAFNPDYLKYDHLVASYQTIFGKANVLILRQEELKSNRNDYLRKIELFCKSESNLPKIPTNNRVNTSLSNLGVSILRIVNHFIFTSQKPNHLIWNQISTKFVSKIFKAILDPYFFRFLSSKGSFVSREDRAFIERYYEESNQHLLTLIAEESTPISKSDTIT